jgi:hypothetical protein
MNENITHKHNPDCVPTSKCLWQFYFCYKNQEVLSVVEAKCTHSDLLRRRNMQGGHQRMWI